MASPNDHDGNPVKKMRSSFPLAETNEQAFLRELQEGVCQTKRIAGDVALVPVRALTLHPSGTTGPLLRRPGSGCVNHGNSCFISAAVAVLRELPRVCEELETRGKNPWASQVMATLHMAAGGMTADTLRLHTLVLDRFPLGIQADSVEFLEILLERALGGISPWLRNTVMNTVSCATPGCGVKVVNETPHSTMRVHVKPGGPWRVTELMQLAVDHVELVEWTCSSCEAKSGFSSDELGELPKYLIVELIRGMAGVGIRARVQAAKVIVWRERMFEQRAAVYYTGETPASGHYISSVCRGEDEWLFNDEEVSEIPPGFRREEMIVAVVYGMVGGVG